MSYPAAPKEHSSYRPYIQRRTGLSSSIYAQAPSFAYHFPSHKLTRWHCGPLPACLIAPYHPSPGDNKDLDQMDIDSLAAAAGAKPKSKDPPPGPKPPNGPTMAELLKGIEPGKMAQLLSYLQKVAEGEPGPELENERNRITKAVQEDPLLDLTGLSPEEADKRARSKQLIEEISTIDLFHKLLNERADVLIKSKRRLEDLLGRKWDPSTSPSKCVEAMQKRVTGGGLSPQNLDAAFASTTGALAEHQRNGIEVLQSLLAEQKNKRLRKSLPEIRTLVAQQLNKLMKKAAECRADGLVDGAGQCLAAYIQLRDVYKLQFEPLVLKLGVRDTVDLVLNVNNPLSDITPEMWTQLSAQAAGGQYSAILARLGDQLPAAKPSVASKKAKRKRSSSSSSSSSDSEEEEAHTKRSKGASSGADPLTAAAGLIASAIHQAAKLQGRSRSPWKPRGSGGRGGRGGGGRGGRGDSKGGRGE